MNFIVPRTFHEITKNKPKDILKNFKKILYREEQTLSPAQVTFENDRVKITHTTDLIADELHRVHLHAKQTLNSASVTDNLATHFEQIIGRPITTKIGVKTTRKKQYAINGKIKEIDVEHTPLSITYYILHSDLPEKERDLFKAIASAKGKEREKLLRLVKRSWLKVA